MGRVPRLVVAFAVAQALRGLTLTNGQELSGISAASACEDFATGQSPALAWSLDAGHNRGQAWTLEDCIEVWTRWSSTIFDPFIPRNPEADLWRDTASELREKGSPCLLASAAGGDGLGSTTLRHVATWIFAGEMGCDWVTPDWGRRKVPKGDGKAVMYCHSIVSKDKLRSHTNTTEAKATQRCSIVDWLSFFQFEKTSVSWPASGSVKVIQARQVFPASRFRRLYASYLRPAWPLNFRLAHHLLFITTLLTGCKPPPALTSRLYES